MTERNPKTEEDDGVKSKLLSFINKTQYKREVLSRRVRYAKEDLKDWVHNFDSGTRDALWAGFIGTVVVIGMGFAQDELDPTPQSLGTAEEYVTYASNLMVNAVAETNLAALISDTSVAEA